MADKTQIELEVKNQQALKAIDEFNKKLLTIGKQGLKASKDLEKSFTAGLSRVNGKIASEFTRDFNKNLRDTAKGSGDTFAKGFGQSLRKSLQPQLAQLKKDIDNSVGVAPSVKSVKGGTSTGVSSASGSSFSSIGAAAIVANQSLELLQKGFNAAAAGYRALEQTLNRGQEVINLSTAFDNLQASVGRVNGIEQFRTATKGLVSDLDLFRSANQAVILGVDKGDESFLQLTTSALKLGRAMGIDAKQSIDSLVIGIGRQSKLVLDNLGVIVQAEKAYDDFARSVHKTSEQLTDSEKKLAFYDAALKAIKESASLLPDIAINAGDAFTQLGNKAENAFNEFAKGVAENQNLTSALSDLSGIIDGIDFTRLGNEAAELAAKFISLANSILTQLAPAFDKLGSLLQSLREQSEIKQLAADYEKLGFAADQAFVVASTNYQEYKNNLQGTKQFVTDLVSENVKLKDSVKLKSAIDELKEYSKYLQAINKDTSNVGQNALKAQIAETTKGIGQLVSRMIALQDKGGEAADTVKKKLSEAEKEAKKFDDAIDDAIVKLSLLGREDPAIEKIRSSAQELAQELRTGALSAEDLRKAFIQLAQEGVKAGLSVADSQRLVNDELVRTNQLESQIAKKQKQKVIEYKEAYKQFEKIGTVKAAKQIDALFGTDYEQKIIDQTNGSKQQLDDLANAIGGAEQQIATYISKILDGSAAKEGYAKTGGAALGAYIGSTYGPIGAAIGEAIGATLGATVDKFFGGGTDDPLKKARKSFKNFLNQLIKDTKGGNDFGSFGLEDIFEADSKLFNQVKKTADEVKNIFGEEFRNYTVDLGDGTFGINQAQLEVGANELLGTFEGIATAISSLPGFEGLFDGLDGAIQQLGLVLALNLENANGLNDLQLLFQGAGLDAEKFGQALKDAYFKGTISAEEFLNGTSSITDLFQQGIPGAIGDAGLAFQNFIDNAKKSGQQGQDALGDIVAEAIEFGKANNINIGGLENISGILVNKFGFSVEQTTQLMSALGQQGINTVEELQNISLLDTAGVIRNLNNVNFAFKDITEGVDDTLKKIDEFKKTANQEVVTNWKIKVKVDGDKIPEEVASQTNIKSIAGPSLR